ncbi:MAG: hypothetical protein K6F61_03855 [Clostridiales bacterium]|nr:hypothetical protein [Clostridiales bacterium]
MGKVQNIFGYGSPGTVTRSADNIIISVRNASDRDVPFGAPVFINENGAEPFSIASPQEFADFLGFAVSVRDKTPDVYPQGQFNDPPRSAWHPGDVMEVLVRGSIALETGVNGVQGSMLYIRKTDGMLVTNMGASGTTLLLENVRVRRPRTGSVSCCEAVVNKRNVL